MLIDLDHLLASPIFAANRCSIGFHPLHSLPLYYFYILLLGFKSTRIWGLGLCLHLFFDKLDCVFMSS